MRVEGVVYEKKDLLWGKMISMCPSLEQEMVPEDIITCDFDVDGSIDNLATTYCVREEDTRRVILGLTKEIVNGMDTGKRWVMAAYLPKKLGPCYQHHLRLDRTRVDDWADVKKAIAREAAAKEEALDGIKKRARQQRALLNVKPDSPKKRRRRKKKQDSLAPPPAFAAAAQG
jgi:hypothetical protein